MRQRSWQFVINSLLPSAVLWFLKPEQYRAAGLQPVDAGSVPTIPEPEMVILLAVVGIFLSWLVFRKYRTSRSGCPV